MKIKNPEEQKADPIQEKAPKNDYVDIKKRDCTLSDEIQKLVLRQLGNELYNCFLYKSFANFYAVRGFEKLEKYYLARSEEEKHHHDWCYHWLTYNDVEFTYPTIPEIEVTWKDMKDPFQLTVDQEINTTENINEIADLAFEQRDWATFNWLHDHNDKTGRLIEENVEEESLSRTVRDIAFMDDADWLKKQDLIYEAYFNN